MAIQDGTVLAGNRRSTRMIYEDTSAFIPAPDAPQHRKTEVIVGLRDDREAPASPKAW
jgi:hypothetical protein